MNAIDATPGSGRPLTLYGVELPSRLLLGTARYPSPQVMSDAARASSASVLTVSVRREAARGDSGRRFFELIKALGVRLLVDDFGTGDSSISYLRQFPIDGIKVDRALIAGLGERTGDAAITAGIVTMARRLNLATIAEGVEEAVQLECLEGFDCGHVQGYLFSPAVPPEEFRTMVLAGAPVRRGARGTDARTSTEGARP